MWKIEKIVSKGDYNYCIVRNHPNRTRNDYVLHHRIVVENHLGRVLNSDEVVHHKNGDKKDNRLSNLEVMSPSDHAKLHGKEQLKRYVTAKCPCCNVIFEREYRQTHLAKKGTYTACSRSCNGKICREIQLNRVTAELQEAITGNILSIYSK